MSIVSGIVSGIQSGILSGIDGFPGGGGAPTPQRQFPASAAEWASKFPSLPAPLAIWICQEGASPLDDKIGTKDMVQNQALLYQRSGDPEPTLSPRLAIEFDTQSTNEFLSVTSDTTFGDIPAGGTRFMLVRFKCPDNGATTRALAGKGSSSTLARWVQRIQATTGVFTFGIGDGTNSQTLSSVNAYDDGLYHDVAFGIDGAGSTVKTVTESENLSAALNAGLATTIATSGLAPAAALALGAGAGLTPVNGCQISYAALFDAIFTAGHMATFRAPQ